jgi:hypothetical protein
MRQRINNYGKVQASFSREEGSSAQARRQAGKQANKPTSPDVSNHPLSTPELKHDSVRESA